ncbi:MAG: hypothetical protein L6R37_008280 [Teloschistes peruensis]|nr:MAG: hypothetical protein L6R37_008280 [Teloschistes peruensis]
MAQGMAHQDVLSMILVMGVTGAGKSFFINKLAGADVVKTGSTLDPCTANCEAVPVEIGRSKVLLIDTPGFDDSVRTDSEILTEISRLLAAFYQEGVSLKGVIYIHRITDIRYAGSQVKTLNIFKKICGELALKNVFLVSSRWHEVDEAQGASREQQLREKFWAYMLGHGSTMTRFYGTRDSAIGIASQLVSKQNIILEIQRELVDEGKTLKQTTAGAFVNDDITEMKARHEEELREIEHLRQTLRDNDRAMKRQVQLEWQREQQRLQTAQQDQERLRRDIAAEVRAEIEQKKESKKGSGLWKAMPLLPSLLGIVEMFVGIPPGSTSMLTSWLFDSGIGESVSQFFANF